MTLAGERLHTIFQKGHWGGIERGFLSFVSLLIFGIILLFIVFFYQESKSMIKREFEIRGSSLIKRFAADCRLGVMLKNPSMLLSPISGLALEEDVVYIALFDPQGVLLKNQARTGEQAVKETGLKNSVLKQLQTSAQLVVEPGDESYNFYLPVRMQAASGDLLIAREGEVVGYAWIGFSSERLDRALSRTIKTSLLFGAVILIAAIVISSFLARKISRPIITISEKMEEIGTGEADLTQRLMVKREDELGRLATGFNNFVKALSNIIQEIANASPKLSEQAQELVYTSEGLATKADSNINMIQQVAQGLNKQLVRINQVVEDAKETQAIARETVESALRSQQSSNKILLLSDEGKVESKAAIENIDNLVGKIQQLTERITTLGSETEKVSNISGTINSIARQTNLLALNASIEAARAGEAGSGFKVIAFEVAKLAEMSRFQAEEIGTIITSLVQKIGVIVKDVKSTQEGMTHSRDVLISAAERLKSISEEMTFAVKDIKAIAEKGGINQEAVNGLVVILDEVVNETQTSATSASSVSASIHEQRSEYNRLLKATQVLRNLSENLKNLVGHFRV